MSHSTYAITCLMRCIRSIYFIRTNKKTVMTKTVMTGCILLLCSLSSFARQTETTERRTGRQVTADNAWLPGWYVGLQGGMPFGVSTFSSFGVDKTHTGWSVGLHGGYCFNAVWSLEAQAAAGQLNMSMRNCCAAGNYWLGADGVRYNAPVAGLDGWEYSRLKSRSTFQRYGLQLNMNLLGWFEPTASGHWTLELSPALAAAGTKARMGVREGGGTVMTRHADWHFSEGGNLQAGYRLSRSLHVGVYSSVSYWTGKRMDGMPEYLHKANFVWESGVRLSWSFGKKAKKQATALQPAVCFKPVEQAAAQPKMPVERQKPDSCTADTATPDSIGKALVEPADTAANVLISVALPTVYFSFNSVWVEPSQQAKVEAIAHALAKHPTLKIRITGYTDHKGTDAVNRRVALMRAEAVKERLVKRYGIRPERILAEGGGVDRRAPEAEARRAQSKADDGDAAGQQEKGGNQQ